MDLVVIIDLSTAFKLINSSSVIQMFGGQTTPKMTPPTQKGFLRTLAGFRSGLVTSLNKRD